MAVNKKTRRVSKRLSQQTIAPIIRRPNAASASSRLSVPFWVYSLKSPKRSKNKSKYTRKTKK